MDLQTITSRDNPWLKDLRRRIQANAGYRDGGQVWLEGDHLCRAAVAKGLRGKVGVFAESFGHPQLHAWAMECERGVVLPDALFKSLSGLDSPARVGFLLPLPALNPIASDQPTLVLDRVQDAGNVGTLLRSAAAFGFTQVLALKGSAALWSQKVLRAAMGAHFALQLHEGLSEDDLPADLPLLVTSSHQGHWLHEADLPRPAAWVMGHEGQGVSESLMDRARLHIRIAQPGGEESLNVAAAAAICLYTSAMRQ